MNFLYKKQENRPQMTQISQIKEKSASSAKSADKSFLVYPG
jgi:hypothetical protein